MLPHSSNNLINHTFWFCLSLDLIPYFRMLHSLSLDRVFFPSPLSLVIYLLADDLLRLQGREPGQRVSFSTNNGGQPIYRRLYS